MTQGLLIGKLLVGGLGVILEPAGTGRRNEPNQTGPSHDASEKHRPNRVEPGKINFRTEPIIFQKVRNRTGQGGQRAMEAGAVNDKLF